jgi:sugar phosphate permease
VLTALYTFVYGFLQLPAGILLDRMSVRALLTLCCLISSAGAMAYGLSPNVYGAGLGSILMGAGTTIAFVGAVFLSRRWFPLAIFGLIAGLTVMVGCVGGALMQQALAFLLLHLGWRGIMTGIGGTGVALAALLWIIVRDKPKNYENDHSEDQAAVPVGLAEGFRIVSSNGQIWLAGIYSGLILGQIIAFGSVWNIPFQMGFYADLTKSVTVNSCVFIGFGVGAPVIGWISDHFRIRVWPTRISAFVVFVSMGLLLWMPPLKDGAVIILMLVLGFAGGGSNLSYAFGVENSPGRVSATALGFVATISFVLGAVLQILPGMFLGPATQPAAHEAGKLSYTISQYRHAFVVFPICSLLAAGVTFMLRETHCRSQVD